ncbi:MULTISPECIES: adenylate/guanylate cyclase domain-containing protein [unclassified Psychrobacter]|uniref:adenylate/guanylate cyclase domain-containing protein n=1 Tax=unclassified Psychrobacter TaxID=196806 RepID=UPI0025B29AD2|nr:MULTISPECIES: adenylate/guanylate cyclase domain-containing protein [unclassified Psychrobacter]MDN3452665.1 adenylate/guanylate cyclase domain-containing protein [Psychrobacter sp. APC 3350]MDN3501148.1 adenylate/guanylate cyclase domain-containing protein [Psychrobacter sp. 5A.1]
MPFSETLQPRSPLKGSGSCRFDYPEVFVLILTVILLALYFDFSPNSMALLVIVCLPSLMILIYNYRRQTSFWTSNIVIILLSAVIGSIQFCTVISLSLAALIGLRVIISSSENHLKLLSVSVITGIVFYYVSVTLSSTEIDCHNSWLPPTILLASMTVILCQFRRVYQEYMGYKVSAHKIGGRLNTMVSVINKLTRFIPPQIWEPIVKSDSPVTVSNKRAKLTIMFSDIVGFTELSDSLSSDNLADILNTYMNCMTSIADKHGAVLDKFIGDGMVCFFGEPDSRGSRQDALNCVAMAIDMRREMRTLRQKWRLMGFEGLYIRIGITTGYCHVGNFGSNNRLSYTMIGKEANLASRLESRADKDQILVSESTYDYICHNYECQYVNAFQLKGFDEKVNAWQVFDPNANKGHLSKWVDHTLPGFNLHLNFRDMKDNDYQDIRARLNFALERIEQEEEKMVKSITAEKARQNITHK